MEENIQKTLDSDLIEKYAEDFDLWCRYYDPDQIELKTLLNILNMEDKTVLEVGSGTGRLTFQMARYVKKIIGIDIDKRLVDYSNKKLSSYQFNNIEFKLMDGRQLEFKNSSFDIVIFTWTLTCIDERTKALNEAYRVLNPEGKIVLLEPAPGSDYSNIVIDFLPKDYPRINCHNNYEVPLKTVFSEIASIIPPFKVPYVFPDFKTAYDIFKFALMDWHKEKMNKMRENILKDKIKSYQKGNGQVVINEIVTVYLAEKRQNDD